MATILNVNAIATDEDLIAEVASKARLDRAMPNVLQRDAIRVAALGDVLGALATRSPAVLDTHLAAPAELRRAVVYRALAKIFMAAVAVEGDVHHLLSKNYEREYQAAVRMRFSLAPGQAGPSGSSFRMERR